MGSGVCPKVIFTPLTQRRVFRASRSFRTKAGCSRTVACTSAGRFTPKRTSLTKTVRRVTVDEYGYGRNRRKLVVALEKDDLITLREQRRRTRHTARLFDVYWWLLRCEADKARMEKLRQRKHPKAAP
jgi:hypothetical protein